MNGKPAVFQQVGKSFVTRPIQLGRQNDEDVIVTGGLKEGDVVTLETGMYVAGVGGLRIEHNYLITQNGFERLSNHTISLV